MKAVIFDCFGVLYIDSTQSIYETHLENYYQLHPLIREVDAQYDYGLISFEEHTEQIADITGLSSAFIAGIPDQHIRNVELLEFIQKLRSNYKIGLLSNIGSHGMDLFFAPHERTQLFDAAVLSSEEGIIKPHPRIFEVMAERLGVETSECMMIDDIAANCAGADAAGMQAIRYISNQQVIRQLSTM